MHTNPKENHTRADHILLEQFRRKGYKCEEVSEDNAIIFIIRHEKKTEVITRLINETCKDLLKNN